MRTLATEEAPVEVDVSRESRTRPNAVWWRVRGGRIVWSRIREARGHYGSRKRLELEVPVLVGAVPDDGPPVGVLSFWSLRTPRDQWHAMRSVLELDDRGARRLRSLDVAAQLPELDGLTGTLRGPPYRQMASGREHVLEDWWPVPVEAFVLDAGRAPSLWRAIGWMAAALGLGGLLWRFHARRLLTEAPEPESGAGAARA